jgi:DNA-binding NarL/FixJ family response regulator
VVRGGDACSAKRGRDLLQEGHRLLQAGLHPGFDDRVAGDLARGLHEDREHRAEAEVLKLIAAGLSNAEIGAALVVSNSTVKTHVNHIFSKTGARDRAQAVRYAYQHGIA